MGNKLSGPKKDKDDKKKSSKKKNSKTGSDEEQANGEIESKPEEVKTEEGTAEVKADGTRTEGDGEAKVAGAPEEKAVDDIPSADGVPVTDNKVEAVVEKPVETEKKEETPAAPKVEETKPEPPAPLEETKPEPPAAKPESESLPEPVAEPEPTPVPESVKEPTPEPVVEATPEPVQDPEPVPEPESEPAPPAPVEPEPVKEPTPEPESVECTTPAETESEPAPPAPVEPEVPSEPEPVAAPEVEDNMQDAPPPPPEPLEQNGTDQNGTEQNGTHEPESPSNGEHITNGAPDVNGHMNGDHKVSTEFQWPLEGENVQVSGTFSDWKEKFTLEKQENGFKTTIDLPTGQHFYKYLVDDQWVVNKDQPIHCGEDGTENNHYFCSHYWIEIALCKILQMKPMIL
ncbi:hypothetical protein LOTGIDRAFT_238680 [Lottia gigantea]|uniref:5'-AMP-activated protein kinase subunit beta-1 n=1 Tax=Lottia gigantea TaxID=225164 RepID=V4AYG7_LOTGI|nr:hypothetical protein LOTGIDRAFT_238680 [Lottia gigantea]ESP00126.1 hypothetical protein LOTGIDRAFT_238680 [Lottia gigantea]